MLLYENESGQIFFPNLYELCPTFSCYWIVAGYDSEWQSEGNLNAEK